MGAHLTVERVTMPLKPYKYDRLGYLFCGACIDCGRGGDILYLRPTELHHDSHMSPREDRCEHCGRTSDAWPVVDVPGTTVVEHTPCKIY